MKSRRLYRSIYLRPNLTFAALFHSSYDMQSSLAHPSIFILLNIMVDWDIQTRLSGERPRIQYGVRYIRILQSKAGLQ